MRLVAALPLLRGLGREAKQPRGSTHECPPSSAHSPRTVRRDTLAWPPLLLQARRGDVRGLPVRLGGSPCPDAGPHSLCHELEHRAVQAQPTGWLPGKRAGGRQVWGEYKAAPLWTWLFCHTLAQEAELSWIFHPGQIQLHPQPPSALLWYPKILAHSGRQATRASPESLRGPLHPASSAHGALLLCAAPW